jgi:hypothetical protein
MEASQLVKQKINKKINVRIYQETKIRINSSKHLE